MINFFFRKRARKPVSKPKKHRVPLAAEQLEPIWLFNRSAMGLVEDLGIIGDKPERIAGARRPHPLLVRKKRTAKRKLQSKRRTR